MSGTPDAEVTITSTLVGDLLTEQHPDLADLPCHLAVNGWDNATFRLGDDLAVRLPRRAVAAELVLHERRVLPALAGSLPLPVPVPVRHGAPGAGYPWSWQVVPWFDGETAEVEPLPPATAPTLGRFLRALHRPAPEDAPTNPFRGVPLADRGDPFRQRVAALDRRGVDTVPLREAFARAVDAPGSSEPCWVHGDLHPRNLLLRGRDLAAVLDWGDVTGGDPATDLAVGWLAYDADGRRALRETYAVDDPDRWVRAAGWAAHLAAALLDAGLTDDPALAAIGVRAVAALAADPEVRP